MREWTEEQDLIHKRIMRSMIYDDAHYYDKDKKLLSSKQAVESLYGDGIVWLDIEEVL